MFRLCGVGKGGSEGLYAGVKWYVEGGAAAEAVQEWRSGMGRSPHSGWSSKGGEMFLMMATRVSQCEDQKLLSCL